MHLSKALAPFARRFVAGETIQDAVGAARKMNARGMRAILDFLGEDVTSPIQAAAATSEYLELLAAIQNAGVDSQVSVKVSQMGILISRDLCIENLTTVLRDAERRKLFVWIDMEGSALTKQTVDLFQFLHDKFQNVGLCVQASLRRTQKDVDELIRRPVALRLCKGAYKEPPDVAFTDKRQVDANYRAISEILLAHAPQGVFPAFATHDPTLINEVLALVKKIGVTPAQFEFQMLYGIQNQLLESLTQGGFQTRVYIPYGTAWLPYFLRRLRERKENVYFLLRNVFRR